MKGQSNYIDFVIALGIFLIILFLFIIYNHSQSQDYLIADEALMISDALMSEGIPVDWNTTHYYRPGIMSNGLLDEAKWESFHNIMELNPEDTRRLYTIASDFIIRIGYYNNNAYNNITINNISHITTDPAISPDTLPQISSERIDRIERIIAYNGSLYVMEVIAWR